MRTRVNRKRKEGNPLVTINDIAKKAGVSHVTVSRILNGKNKMNGHMAKKVLDVAQKLGYKIKQSQVGLPASTNTIGIAIPTYLANPFYFNVYESIYKTADELGYALRIRKMNDLHVNQTNVDLFKTFDGTVDGIIFVGHFTITPMDIQRFIDRDLPMVSLLNKLDIDGVTNILSDVYTGAYEATDYLIRQGHKKIIHIMGHPKNKSSVEKMNGYINALEDNGLHFDPSFIKIGNFSYEETYHCSVDLLNEFHDISAVFCCTDEMAVAFMRAASDKGVRIPEDISVIGFDDMRRDNIMGQDMPFITTVRQPRQEMAKYAVQCLYNRIHGIRVSNEKTYRPTLVIRNSVAQI